ncbi:uncharacterized protein LOC128232559 [Mya arenaria]|nr:uncharacterized protein LOC128232559 [Mya arenaria]
MPSNVESSFSTTVANYSGVIISSTTDAVNVTLNSTDMSTFLATEKLTPASTSNSLMSTHFKNISATKTSSENMYSSHAVSTPEPTRTTENATTAREKNWVKTVLKVQKNINVSDPTFRMETEQGLANAYSEAFLREKLIAEGQFDPLEDRKRRKRYTTVGDAAVHVHELLRTAGSSAVTAVYTVERQGRVMDAEEAVAALVTLDTQELAIILRQVVAVKAETYIPTTTQTTPTSDESQIWLIAAIAGGAGGALLIVFITICIYCKCCRHKPVGNDDGDPELMSIEEPAPRKRSLPPSPSKRPLPRQRSSVTAIIPTKLRSYGPENPELSESGHGRDEEEHLLYPPPIKHSTPSKGRLYIPVEKSCTPPPSARDLAPPAQRSRRESRNSISPATEFMELATSSMHSEGLQPDRADMFQTSFTEDNEHVKQHLHEEKKKNKVKLRGQHADMNGDVTAMNETILGMQNTSVPHLVIESGRLVRDNTTEQEEPPDNGKSGDENIAEARKRMHRLLDDAFSLISPGNSFSEKDLRIQQQNKTDENKEKEKQASNTTPVQPELKNALVSSQSDVPTAKPDGQGYTNPAYKALYGDYLETWSPYRAYDQVALISMPNKMDIPVTKLGQKSNNNLKGRRPATDLNVLDLQDTTTIDGSTYTKDPGKPILLRTKEERPSSGKPPQLTNNYVDERTSKFSFNGSVPHSRSSSGVNTGFRNTSKDHHVVKSETNAKENRRESDSLQQHRRPERNIANKDVVDIVSDINSEEKNERLIKSIRDELRSTKVEKEEDINKKPIRRRSRKVKKPMTDV